MYKRHEPTHHMTEYLFFESVAVPEARKTGVWNVGSRNGGDLLGIIKWFGRWRQYTFWPERGTTFNKGCLEDINEFMDKRMKER